jgi:PKHD-type hydroxylase
MSENTKEETAQSSVFVPTWYWKRAVPDYVIQCLEHELKDIPTHKGGTYSNPGAPGVEQDVKIRNSDVAMFDATHWFSGILYNLALASNFQAEWNFSILGPEILQIASYGPEQHYTWHPDHEMLRREHVIRKLSVICMLSDSSEYSGGDLEFDPYGEVKLERGDVIVFPSFLKHRVVPVTEGLRKTAVIWVSGYRSHW